MSRWPDPGLEPTGYQRQGLEESPSRSPEDEAKCSLGPRHRELSAFPVLLVYCLSQTLWVNVYEPLLGLSVVVADLASYYLSISVVGFYILWRSGLQTAGALMLILVRKLCVDVVVPTHQAVWQPWLEMKAWSLAFLLTLLRWAWGCARELLRSLSHQVGAAVFSWAEAAYGSLARFYQDKGRALEVIMGSILQQLFFTLLMSCLSGFWAVCSQWGMVIRGKCSWLLDSGRRQWGHPVPSLETCASSLSSSRILLSQRFPGPDPSSLSWRSPDSVSLSSLVVQREAEGGGQDCPWRGSSQMPLNVRFQGRRAASPPSGQALVQQVKTACILVILLYIFGATLFIQILK